MQLDILYEDKEILVCYKPAAVATQTAKLSSQDMVSMIKNYLAKKDKSKVPYVGIIHRLDMPVSGLLVFAKNKKAAANLSKQIQDGNANKDYIALCSGTLVHKKGTLIHYISKDARTNMAKAIDEDAYAKLQETEKDKASEYKKAVLSYEVKQEKEDATLINIHLETGRFHQIRAQFAAIGNPLLGDGKYATVESRELSLKKQIGTIALCANQLSFLHPLTGKKMEFILKEDFLPKWYLCK